MLLWKIIKRERKKNLHSTCLDIRALSSFRSKPRVLNYSRIAELLEYNYSVCPIRMPNALTYSTTNWREKNCRDR